ncbi:tRNA threonylcarbamoyladenosine biosynthesis protein TsaB-like [Globicephala melas]|uniref:tRNA threonylcarbamoyladenosine biosynthesis protein TsaB-like n=1 Tax=Globicephala melas TaxID=9731 RepID=UPI00293D71A7|nr:tRNA threonylcarbamoyladenosine biosynthesis protein TsaB-like [Globicephala melas]
MNIEDNKINLLMLDTSTSVCSVAISSDTEILESRVLKPEKAQHAAILPPIVDELLKEIKQKGIKLSAVVISSGPGSYTGLRIGSSLAKGLAHGLGLPLIAISTLEMMARGYSKEYNLSEEDTNIRLMPMIDARRMEVYTALYNVKGQELAQEEAMILTEEALPYSDLETMEVHLFGNGSEKCIGLWDKQMDSKQIIIKEDFLPKAADMLELALEAYKTKDFVDLAYWTPNYLKDYVAKIAKNKVLGI